VLNRGDYDKYFRFGHFNNDTKTDIFRYDNNRFLVYWGGKGDYEVINKEPAAGLKMDNLLFANNFSATGLTDVIYVDQQNKKWTTYYGGKPGTIPMPMDFTNPDKIHFGNVQSGAGWEPIVMDYIPAVPGFSEQIDFPNVFKAETESFVIAEYKPGSLKKVAKAGVSSFVYDMELIYHPGTNTTKNDFSDYSTISRVNGKVGTPDLIFKPGQRTIDEKKIIGTIEGVKIDSKDKNEIEVVFANNTRKKKLVAPAYSIGAVPNNITETPSATGNWAKWASYVTQKSVHPGITINEGNKPPGKIEKINKVELELMPFYSSLERGNVSMVEMGAPMQELNGIVYGTDKAKIVRLYGSEKVFTIKWKYELKNLSTNKIVAESNSKLAVATGKWADNKVAFTYPETDDLLQLTITAIITDAMGIVAVKPLEMIFNNQRIVVPKDETVLKTWVNNLGNSGRKEYLQKRISYLAEDGVLTPDEMISLFK